ncbi:MAG: transglutaminase domain-containing protein [Alphaproteobacteria bacterium]|nr:transglutaminase domain-containing protein [Alphaproteobacteria bacterium]
MRSPRLTPLTVVEACALVAFIVLVGVFASRHQQRSTMVPIDVEALSTGATEERWMGIFFEDQKVGYAVTRSLPTADGGSILEGRSRFRLAAFGTIQDIITAQAAVTDADGALRRFDFFMLSDQVRISARGEVRGSEIVMEVDNAGDTNTFTFPVSEPPHVQLSLEQVLAREEFAIGRSWRVPYFNPATMAEGTIEYTVEDVVVLDNGEEAWWVRTDFEGITARELVLTSGEVIRQESPSGMSMVRMSAEAAKEMPVDGEAVDIIAKSAVPLRGGRLDHPRTARRVSLKVLGVEPERVLDDPPLQVRDGDVVTIEVPLLEELAAAPLTPAEGAEIDPEWLESSPTIQARDERIVARAREVVGDATDRLEAARRLNSFVYDYVEKVPVFGVPSGAEVLETGRGDCNEHTALFVSLARSQGIPTRIAAGVVWSDRVPDPERGSQGAFYYHAWPEVLIADDDAGTGSRGWRWMPVDPTFGQFPADATHVKLVEGDLDRQVEILAVMGRLAFELKDSR